jgi:HKD family nuclease
VELPVSRKFTDSLGKAERIKLSVSFLQTDGRAKKQSENTDRKSRLQLSSGLTVKAINIT